MMGIRLTPAQIALLALCGALAVVLFYELFAPLGAYQPPAVDSSRASYSVAMPQMYTPPAFETFANVDEKSVFNPLRTPILTDAGGGATAAGDALPSDLALVGVILDGPTKMALLKSATTPLAVGIPEGGVFEGWEIASVAPDMVVFAAHGSRQELKLSANKPPAKDDSDQSDDQSSDNASDDATPPPAAHLPQGHTPPKPDDSGH
ncbi:MAG: hypothetical protein WBQ17_07265 [Rhizomicrobium sp.]